MKNLLIFFLLFAICKYVNATRPYNCYDHQVTTYNSQFDSTQCGVCEVTPFFSPDTSLDVYIELIKSAQESIDIYTPSFGSWSGCTSYKEQCQGCTNCSIEQQRNEAFPVFPALLNAVHQGVQIRILTNNFTIDPCIGKIAPLNWLVLNNIEVKMYTTTTFQHAKFMIVDGGKKTSLSSVNWSYTSFLLNRESGVVLNGCYCATDQFQKVFDYDWQVASQFVLNQKYSSAQMKIITDKSYMSYEIPNHQGVKGAFKTKLITYKATINNVYISPDNSRDILMSYLPNIKSSLQVAIYQLTDVGICDALIDISENVNVTVLVSDYIVSYIDYKAAQACYAKLYNANIKVQYAYSKLKFSHEKYWIIDNTEVHLNTGNWSPSDFPLGSSWPPASITHKSINRDFGIVLENNEIVKYFQNYLIQIGKVENHGHLSISNYFH